ncbi:MAG: glycosyltransferase family 4 protein [Methanocellales archaeon]|nr:glycosyltransferase family 4 protein [Methanocellales archaeon]
MRVVMLGWEFPPFRSGGLGVHCYELTHHLVNKGVSIDFYMPKTGHKIRSEGSVNIIEIGAEPSLSPYSRGNPKNKVYDLDFFDAVDRYNARCVEIVKGDCDLVHCHDWITIRAGIQLKKLTGKSLIFTVHSTEYDRTGNINPLGWIVDIEKEGIKKADRIITVSKRMKGRLIELYGADPDKIKVIYNGVNLARFMGKKRAGEKIVLFLGRLTTQKGPEFFIRAAERVLEKEPDAKFIVCGTGDLLPRLIKLTIDLGLMDKVTFTGFVSDEEVAKLYSISDVYVMPSVSEPFGITVLEAMSSGTPTIISKESGVSEALAHCLKVDFWDVNELANKIIALLRYRPLNHHLSENGIDEAREFTWETTADKTFALYKEVC